MSGHPIYFLWATPRSTSTAFEWMMRQRGDMTCFHEPFGKAWYQGPQARAPRKAPIDKQQPEATFDHVWQQILDAAQERPVFVKDMPHHTDHMWTGDFLDRITHSFLVRDPAKVLASLHRSYQKAGMSDGFEPNEVSFAAQEALFDKLNERYGKTPVVIDSDDLLESPQNMVAAYCDGIGVNFIKEALSWEPGARNEVLWYDGNDEVWHASLRDSDGLKPQARKTVAPDSLPTKMQQHHRLFVGPYTKLHAHRIHASTSASLAPTDLADTARA
jgi:LPS sulfotransferase NodH